MLPRRGNILLGGEVQSSLRRHSLPSDPAVPENRLPIRPHAVLIGALISALAAPVAAQESASTQVVPLFPAASDTGPQGLARIVNHSEQSGTVDIVAIDDAGTRIEGLSLSIGAGQAANIDSDDLESGNAESGLSGSTGPGEGDWHLELTSGLDVEVQAYGRGDDGVLDELLGTAVRSGEGLRLATFGSGDTIGGTGLLRLINRSGDAVEATVQGTDDLGVSPASGVTIELAAWESRTYTAAELESGDAPGLTGSLGGGSGLWRLDVEAPGPVMVMSLVEDADGRLTNLSGMPAREFAAAHRVPLLPPASDPHGREGLIRVINRSGAPGEVRIEAFDWTGRAYGTLTLALGANEAARFDSDDLELGNPDRGLTGNTGVGEGDWRLKLTSDLDIEVLAYVRAAGGPLSPIHDTAAREPDGLRRHYVPIFHAAGHEGQESRLLLFNAGEAETRVSIAGIDDSGTGAPEGKVSLTLGAGQTQVLTATELEAGGEGFDGQLGAGTGRWRMFLTSFGMLQAMGLGYGTDQGVANLSRGNPPPSNVLVIDARVGAPDLAVESLLVDEGVRTPDSAFVLSATVRNRGIAAAEATTLRYYLSSDTTITTSDTAIGTDPVDELAASAESAESITLLARSAEGTYYYGACVDAVAGELKTENNCSAPVRVHVGPPGPIDVFIPAGCPLTMDICVKDQRCVDGDTVRVSVNGSVLFTADLARDWTCETTDLVSGRNSIEAYAVDEGGPVPRCEIYWENNTGLLGVRVGGRIVAQTAAWSLQPGESADLAIRVQEGEPGDCPEVGD